MHEENVNKFMTKKTNKNKNCKNVPIVTVTYGLRRKVIGLCYTDNWTKEKTCKPKRIQATKIVKTNNSL